MPISDDLKFDYPTFDDPAFDDAKLLELAQTQTLRGIALYDTAVSDDGLIALARASPSLTHFHISSPLLTDRGLGAVLAHCPIVNLQVHNAIGVTDASAQAIASRSGIFELYLNGTAITDTCIRALSSLRTLWSLCAIGTRVSDAAFETLSDLPMLTALHLSGTNVQGRGLRALAKCARLTLCLERCPIIDRDLDASLGALDRLRWLSLSDTPVSDSGLDSIEACSQLESLRLNSTSITDRTLERLARLPKLVSLQVKGTAVTPAGVDRLRAVNRRLHVSA